MDKGEMGKEDYSFDTDDDPYRNCHDCELSYYENDGSRCDTCDEWICSYCNVIHKCKLLDEQELD